MSQTKHGEHATTALRRKGAGPALSIGIALIVFTFAPGLTQCNQTCYDYDEDGNRIVFECTTCVERDDNPCTVDNWRLPPASMCALDQQPLADDGTPCDANGLAGACASGVCEPGPVLAAGSGSTSWLSQRPTGGCFIHTPFTIGFDVEVTMHASSDGAGNLSIGYTATVGDPLLPLLPGGVLVGAVLQTTLTDATPNAVTTSAEPFAVGAQLSELLPATATEWELATARGTLTEETIAVSPTSAGPVNVNFTGELVLDFGGPLVLEDRFCFFDVQGAGVEFPIGGCTNDSECDDGNECTTNTCNPAANRCEPAIATNEGLVCDPGTGMNDGQCQSGTCYLVEACRIGTTAINEGEACTTTAGSTSGFCQAGLCVLADACSRDRDCELDGNECTAPSCDTSVAPYVCTESIAVADGTWCNGFEGACSNGVCEATGRLAPFSAGSGQWRATTSPPGGVSGATGGCTLTSTGGGTFALDTTVTFNASTDVHELLTVDYVFELQNALLPSIAVTPDRLVTVTFVSANGFDSRKVSIADYPPAAWNLSGDTLLLDVPGVPDAAWTNSTSTANVNWSGEFDADFDGFETMTEADCLFDIQDAGLDFPVVVGAPPPAGCTGGDCGPPWEQQAYIKASNADVGDELGTTVALDGDTLVVGARQEDSIAVGVNPANQANNAASYAGAVYIYERVGNTWSQVAYVKASNAAANQYFGRALAIDGDTIVVGSSQQGPDGAGAVYVFERIGGAWAQTALLTAPNGDPDDGFGHALAIEGNRLLVGAIYEDSSAAGVDGDESDNSATGAGAAYVFEKVNGSWTQAAYLKPNNPDPGDWFGISVALAGDLVVVGSDNEQSFNGDPQDNSGTRVGAAYVFERIAGNWTETAYLKPSNPQGDVDFGETVAATNDTVAVGASGQSGTGQGVGAQQNTLGATSSGAVYVFERIAGQFTQTTYVKASNAEALDYFGRGLALSGDTLLVGAPGEASAAVGAQGDQSNNASNSAGATYVFDRVGGAWSQVAYLKPSNTWPTGYGGSPEGCGTAVDISGNTLVMGKPNDASSSREVNGHQYLTHGGGFGAAYVIERTP